MRLFSLDRDRICRFIGIECVAFALFCFLVLKAYAIPPHSADEGIYFYGASKILQGRVPYRDFFFAHPPIHLLITSIVFLVKGGYNFVLAKSITYISAALQGLVAYAVVQRGIRMNAIAKTTPLMVAREVAAVAAALALLFSGTFLKSSSSDTGINQAGGVLAVATLLFVYGHRLAAGIVAACASMTLIQAAPVAAVLIGADTLAANRPWKTFDRWRSMVGAVSTVLVIHLVFSAFAGRAFFEQVYLYHINKPERDGEGLLRLGFVIVDNWSLFATGLFGSVVLFARAFGQWLMNRPAPPKTAKKPDLHTRRRKSKTKQGGQESGSSSATAARTLATASTGATAPPVDGAASGLASAMAQREGASATVATIFASTNGLALVFTAAALGEILAMASRPRVYQFYFQPAFLPCAILIGLSLYNVLERLIVGADGTALPFVRIRASVALAAGFIIFTVLRLPLSDIVSPKRADQRANYEQTYDWADAPYIGDTLNGLVKRLFWQEGLRKSGNDYNTVTEYLWQRSNFLDTLPQLRQAVRDWADRRSVYVPRDSLSLFGNSAITPLLALDTDLSVLSDIIDTNIERFRTGSLTVEGVTALLEDHPEALLVLNPAEGVGSISPLFPYFKQKYNEIARFRSHTGVVVSLLSRKGLRL